MSQTRERLKNATGKLQNAIDGHIQTISRNQNEIKMLREENLQLKVSPLFMSMDVLCYLLACISGKNRTYGIDK